MTSPCGDAAAEAPRGPQDAALLRAEERVTALVLLHHARGDNGTAHVALVALIEARAVRLAPVCAPAGLTPPALALQVASNCATAPGERALALQLLSQAGGGAEVSARAQRACPRAR